MKESNLSFFGPDVPIRAEIARSQGAISKAFDFDKAATFIKQYLKDHPDLVAEAGLEGDWNYTGGVIFENSKPVSSDYTYLASNWAMPTLILSWDGNEQMSFDCWTQVNNRFNSGSKWDAESLAILDA